MSCCSDGFQKLFSKRGASNSPISIDVEALGFDDSLSSDEAGRNRLLQLATALEGIDEARTATDRKVLTKLVRRYEEKHELSRTSCDMSELPSVEELSPAGFKYKMLPLPTAEEDPILDGTTAMQLVEHLQSCPEDPLHPHFMTQLLNLTRKLHEKRSRESGPVMKISVPGLTATDRAPVKVFRAEEESKNQQPRLVVLGDTHGQLTDVLWAFARCGAPSENNMYVFNGDVADRSPSSTEIFALIFVMMLQYPNENVVILNRGNHECIALNGSRCGGFSTELFQKYGCEWGPYIHELFGAIFAFLPLATIVNESIFIVHAGIGRNPDTFLKNLQDVPEEYRESQLNPWSIRGDPLLDAMDDAMWADPGDDSGSQPNSRGNGHVWGPDYTDRFLRASKLQLIIRSHQLPRDRSGFFLHESHEGHVITLFSASNYGKQGNHAAAITICSCSDHLALQEIDLGLCPSHSQVANLPLLLHSGEAGHDTVLLSPKRKDLQHQNELYNQQLKAELLQQAMGLLVEFRVALWDACTTHDVALTGMIDVKTWSKVCRKTSNNQEIDWVLVAQIVTPNADRTVSGSKVTRINYMELLGRFGFKIESQVVSADLAEAALSKIFLTMMRADQSLQELMGKLCSKGDALPPAQMLAGFKDLLSRNGFAVAELGAVVRSLQAHIGMRSKTTVSIAEFLSAWKCAAHVCADLDLSESQKTLVASISNLLHTRAVTKEKPRRRASMNRITATGLMEFFQTADEDGNGYLSVSEGVHALCQLLQEGGVSNIADAASIQALLEAADTTRAGSLNYLEFLRLFAKEESSCLTHQSLLDEICFQVWSHRNALSGLFRFVGTNGRINRSQILWSLKALNTVTEGRLTDDSIISLVRGIKFSDGVVVAEEFLRAFELIDLGGAPA